MLDDKTIVVTVCGHDRTIDRIGFSVFEEPEPAAENYCKAINTVEMPDGSWIYANNSLSENALYSLADLLPWKRLRFSDVILGMDALSLQKVIRETDALTLARAVLTLDEETRQEKIFCNMSKNAGAMLREDIDAIIPVRLDDVMNAQNKIMDTIRELQTKGVII